MAYTFEHTIKVSVIFEVSLNRVWLVEDDIDIREITVEALELEEFKVTPFENGQLAYDSISQLSRNQWPECIVLDLNMPVMDGQKFLESVYRDFPEFAQGVPIVITTARGSAQSLKFPPFRIFCIQKPYDVTDLYQAIARQVST